MRVIPSYICPLTLAVLRIRKYVYVSEESTRLLVHSFVTRRLNYGNSILYGLPKYLIRRFKSVQLA